jgi:hypothetical protein
VAPRPQGRGYDSGMSYFTMALGLALVGLGLYGKFGLACGDSMVLLPSVYGLAYMTCGEGMRTLKPRRRLFLALAIILSFIAIAMTFKSATLLPAAWHGEAVLVDQHSRIQPVVVATHAALLVSSALYLPLALVAFFRSPR